MTNPLFSPGDDWPSNACLNWSHDSIRNYLDGYRKGADVLAHKVVETSTDQDTLIFPIVFLYRQYIELHLKYIIRESRILLSEGTGFPEHHKIKALWDLANGLMNKITKDIDPSAGDFITKDDLAIIDTIINHFSQVDPESFSFRYPNDKKGNNTLDGLTHINIRNLHDQMEILACNLDKFQLVVDYIRDWHSEYQP